MTGVAAAQGETPLQVSPDTVHLTALQSSSSILEPIVEDADVRIAHAPGDPARHVIAFAGIGGGMQGIQIDEWRQSLSGAATATFVTDKRRGWYNGTFDRIRRELAGIVIPDQRVVTLGNSMGGFGALYFASLIPGCVRAIAFAPQFTVHPELWPTDDHRFADYRRGIVAHARRHALDHPSDDVDYVAIFGTDPRDIAHAELMAMRATPRTSILLIDEPSHAIAAHLKAHSLIGPLLGLLLGDDPFDPAAVVKMLVSGGVGATLLIRNSP